MAAVAQMALGFLRYGPLAHDVVDGVTLGAIDERWRAITDQRRQRRRVRAAGLDRDGLYAGYQIVGSIVMGATINLLR